MGEGGDAALGWTRQLEADTGIEPLWEVLFQLAAHPVPQVTGDYNNTGSVSQEGSKAPFGQK
jgi:hypothetical protein